MTKRKIPLLPLKVIESDAERMRFLPHHFGRYMMRVEARLYAYAEAALDGYHGGYWHFAHAGNGAPVMFPAASPPAGKNGDPAKWKIDRIMDHYGSFELSSEAAGLALTIMAVNHEWHDAAQKKMDAFNFGRFEVAYRHLYEVARAHPEAEVLIPYLD